MYFSTRSISCKALFFAALITLSVSFCVSFAYAYTVRRIPSFWFDYKYVFVAENVSPCSSSLDSVTISYDSLADLVYYCNEHKLNSSLVYNSSLNRYVGYVSDESLNLRTFGFSSLCGLLCNSSGKVYVAEDPRSNITINTPTNPDYTDRLINIASNLDFLPIIAELNVLIADNQLLTMDYISLAIQGIWDLQDSMIDRFDVVFNRLAYIGSHIASVDSLLSSVVKDDKVQINTTALEARLDKLISMYSKVNSVVLDTASVNGGSITDAVGGELKDVVFWGNTLNGDRQFLTPDNLWYRLGPSVSDTSLTTINEDIVLRSINLGTSVPSYIANDPVLYAGVWKRGTDYIISDTYNATTGEYVQRIYAFSVGGYGDEWILYLSHLPAFILNNPSVLQVPLCVGESYNAAECSHFPVGTDLEYHGYSDLTPPETYPDSFVIGYSFIRFSYKAGLDSFKTYLQQQFEAGTPVTFYFVPDPNDCAVSWSPTIQYFDPHTIAIPEGDSYIGSYNVRITGKYETYSSFTQTADIITAINNIQFPSIGTGTGTTGTVDLTTIETTLSTISDKLDNTASNVENTVINITSDNDAYNVFYIEDEDGNTQSVTDFAGDLTGASGRLLSLLYRLVFADALNSVDSDLDNLEEFFASEEPVLETASVGGNATYEVMTDVWATS